MNKITIDRLSRYSAAAATVVASAATVDAQIVYTDINPDHTFVDSANYSLDLNNDNINDFLLFGANYGTSSYTYGGIVVLSANSASVNGVAYASSNIQIGSSSNNITVAQALDGGDMINGLTDFNYAGLLAYYGDFGGGPFLFGQFPAVGDKFIGLKFQVGGSYYYGWARVEVSSDGRTITIRDYAYHSGVGFPIAAGDTGNGIIYTGVEEAQADGISLFYHQGTLTIANEDAQKSGQVDIYNMNGALLQTTALQPGQNTVEMNDVASGIYLIRAHYGTAVVTKKIVVQD